MRLSTLSVLVGATMFGCGSDPLSLETSGLVGAWRSQIQVLQPQGSMEGLFVVTVRGRAEDHTITRGLYQGQSPDDLSSEQVLYGRIEVGTNKFIIYPDSLVTRDLFYGPSYRSVQRDFTGTSGDSTSYVIRGNELQLEYYSYPADAPVLTQRVLYRVR